MFALAHSALLQIVFALTLALPGLTPLLQGASLEAIEQSFNSSLGERGDAIAALGALEAQHQRLAARISRLKNDNSTGITTRLALETMLRESQELTLELEVLQNRIRSIDSKIQGQRTRMISGIETEMRSLERSLSSSNAGERRGVVKRLNSLRSQRTSLTAPLPAIPSIRTVEKALVLGADSDDPDTLNASADELEDTEDQLQRRVDAIEGRLVELRNTQRLMRRAQNFSREERFFEEDNRDRVIAKYSKVTVTQTDTNKSGSGAVSAPTDGNNSAGANNGAEAAEPMFDGAVSSDDGMRGAPQSGDGATPPSADNASPDTAAPEVPSDHGTLFDTTSERVVINSSDSPEHAIASDRRVRSSGSYSSEIERLERERLELKKRAETLNKRANELRAKANSF